MAMKSTQRPTARGRLSARYRWALLSLVFVLSAACGGPDDGSTSEGVATGTPTPEETVEDPPSTPTPPTPTPTPVPTVPPGAQRVFVTSQRYPADLESAGLGFDGLSGGDNICQKLAAASGLTGTWTAWVSSSSRDP